MERVWSVELPNHFGRKVVIVGWLLRLRRLSHVSFVILRDGRGLAQAVLDDARLIEQAAPSTPTPIRAGQASQIHSTCSFAAWS